jgi:hypothetical protein
MNLLRNAEGVGASAALLGPLVGTIAAPWAFASTSVTSAGAFPSGDLKGNGDVRLRGERARGAHRTG